MNCYETIFVCVCVHSICFLKKNKKYLMKWHIWSLHGPFKPSAFHVKVNLKQFLQYNLAYLGAFLFFKYIKRGFLENPQMSKISADRRTGKVCFFWKWLTQRRRHRPGPDAHPYPRTTSPYSRKRRKTYNQHLYWAIRLSNCLSIRHLHAGSWVCMGTRH